MGEKEVMVVSGLAIKGGDEAPESFRLVPSGENLTQVSGSTVVSSEAAMPLSMAVVSTEKVKKKRGRPRKYAADGSVATTLSPMPISASIPLTGEFPGWKQSTGKGTDSFKKKHKLEFESPIGERVAYSGGASFIPHVMTVNAGEDVAMKIISFSQQGSRAICILAANGSISTVTLRQPNTSGGTLTYEGRFEILSLTGSFIPSDSGVAKSRSGGMSVSLAGPDGRVLGGGLAGILLAAGSVQVVVASFLPGNQLEQNPKRHKFEHSATFGAVPLQSLPDIRTEEVYSAPKPIFAPAASIHGGNLVPVTAIHTKISAPENIFSTAVTEPKDPSRCEISC